MDDKWRIRQIIPDGYYTVITPEGQPIMDTDLEEIERLVEAANNGRGEDNNG